MTPPALPDDWAHLRRIRRELEDATSTLRALTWSIDRALEAGETFDLVDRAIIDATIADAARRGERAGADAATWYADHRTLLEALPTDPDTAV